MNDILNTTVAILCCNQRELTAHGLDETDSRNEKYRDVIVREIDQIRSKLDNLSTRDLFFCLSFFKEGITRLYSSLETSNEQPKQLTTTSEVFKQNESDVEDAAPRTADQIPVKQTDTTNPPSELSKLVENIQIDSREHFRLAVKSLKEATILATEAFCNGSLSTTDRILASKLRIACRILICLNEPAAAVQDCFNYLKELHDLPGVQTMFSTPLEFHNGITSRLRGSLKRKKTIVKTESIQNINELLLDFIMKFTNLKIGLLSWPTIKVGKTFYHPLMDDQSLKIRIEQKETQAPWLWKFETAPYWYHFALTSKREILSTNEKLDGLDIMRKDDESKVFYNIPPGIAGNNIRCFAVDEDDNVFILVEIPSHNKICPPRYTLLTVDVDGKEKAEKPLDLIEKQLVNPQMSLAKEGVLVIFCKREGIVYVCDSTNATEDYKFPIPFKKESPDGAHDEFSLTVSDTNEIIFTFLKDIKRKVFMLILTMDGTIKRTLEVPRKINRGTFSKLSVVFNHVNKTILVSLYFGNWDENDRTVVLTLTNTGEFLHEFEILGWYPLLISHPKGNIALVKREEALMLQVYCKRTGRRHSLKKACQMQTLNTHFRS